MLKLHIPTGVEHEYLFLEDPRTGSGPAFALGIQKIKGKWRLCHGKYYFPNEYYDEGVSWHPLVECSIEDRVQAVEHIVDLRTAVVESSEEFIPKADVAIESLERSIDQMRRDEELPALLAERAKLNGHAPRGDA